MIIYVYDIFKLKAVLRKRHYMYPIIKVFLNSKLHTENRHVRKVILDEIHAKRFSAKSLLHNLNVHEQECASICGWLRIPRTMFFAFKVSIRHLLE